MTTVLGKLGRRHLGMRKPWTSHSDSRWRRKMIPQANRWMICLTVLFRVEKFQQILRSHPPCQGKRSSLRWHPAGHPSPRVPTLCWARSGCPASIRLRLICSPLREHGQAHWERRGNYSYESASLLTPDVSPSSLSSVVHSLSNLEVPEETDYYVSRT